jgi:hypothetical protein
LTNVPPPLSITLMLESESVTGMFLGLDALGELMRIVAL